MHFDGHHQFEDIRLASDPPIGKLKNPRYVSRVCEEVSKAVSAHVKQGRLPLTLGGDHSLGMATISGTLSQYPDACVIWVDAHADIHKPETTESGALLPTSQRTILKSAQATSTGCPSPSSSVSAPRSPSSTG